jgi:hypothetical protein
MEQNADHSVVSAAVRRGQQSIQQSTRFSANFLPETVLLCAYAQSESLCTHCVCAMCSVVHLVDTITRVWCAEPCTVAADSANEEHARRVLSIIADVGVAMTRRSPHHQLCSWLHCASCVRWCPGRLGGLPPPVSVRPYWMCLVTCLTCLRTLNLVTNPLYHAFKCMLLEQEGPSFPVSIVPQTAAWTPVLHNRKHPSSASVLICGS